MPSVEDIIEAELKLNSFALSLGSAMAKSRTDFAGSEGLEFRSEFPSPIG